MDGKAAAYTPENLFKYIDGEAELYLPYGFEKAAVARYVPPAGKGYGIVAGIFEDGIAAGCLRDLRELSRSDSGADKARARRALSMNRN